MLKLIRPVKPVGFQDLADVETNKIEQQLVNSPDKLEFNDGFWGKYKHHFMTAQSRKCGYCEMPLSDYGDVEHYRPKSVVDDIDSEGSEREALMNVSGRKFKKSCKYGYWWLAYDWDNYLLSCKLCNQPWKRALFPIQGGRIGNDNDDSEYPHKSPQRGAIETPLLLNPYDVRDLSEHIKFNSVGLIEPFENSEFGKETIRTCGLDRLSLFQARGRVAKVVNNIIDRFSRVDDLEQATFLGQIILDMGDKNSAFAGMVRLIFHTKSEGCSWESLEHFVASNAPVTSSE
ncbi:hypothetical protein [Vibrio ouci]|uniref:HNH endonuclease n=1 Tax=Vibrio ouci TaxID=2499078 RepID=A0A4Y8W9D2_9VIBR|nr:hypothetical protein [Vibrio ouci]TFH89246.1 hypothetical protein ELS82_23270 [Vibrio ouci]